MNAIDGAGARVQAALRRKPARPRVRPGDSPEWVDGLQVSPEQAREWRARAHAIGLGVDAWAAVLLEFDITCAELDDVAPGSVGDVVTKAEQLADLDRLAPSPALRTWSGLLSGKGAPADDELPTLVLPGRLVWQVRPGELATRLLEALASARDQEAFACEQAATYEGRTLEGWMLREALRLRR